MHVIRPFMSYASVIWTSCDKEQLYRVLKLKLQKRVARVILYADRQASSVALFNKLSWIPFYEQPMTDKCSISYKRINGTLPSYLNDHIIINNNRLISSRAQYSLCQYKYCMSQVLQRNRGRTNFFSICGETMEQCPVRYRQGRLATLF